VRKSSKKPKSSRKTRLNGKSIISMIATIVTILKAIFEIVTYYIERN